MEKSVFPEIKILPSLGDVARFVGKVLSPLPTEAPLHMSNHYRGASEMLDAHLQEPTDGEAYQPTLPFSNFIDRSRS